MNVKTFCGVISEKLPEFEQLLEIKTLLETSDIPGPIYMVTNFRLANGEVDCLLLRPQGPVILELKSIEGEIHGDENSEWYVISKDGKTIPLTNNLFRQVGQQRFDFLDKLIHIGQKQFPHIDEYDLRKVATWGYFKSGSHYPENQINLRRVPWFDIVTNGSLIYKLKFAKSGYTLTQKDMDHIVNELHVKECTIEIPKAAHLEIAITTLPTPSIINKETPISVKLSVNANDGQSEIQKRNTIPHKLTYVEYGGKYSRLITYLDKSPVDEITLSYKEILDIIKVDLPSSAYKWTMWWQNIEQPHVSAWMDLGWSASKINLSESITFKRGKVNKPSRNQSALFNDVLILKLKKLSNELDFPALYKGYLWKNDSWQIGFKDIVRLELEISKAAKNNLISYPQIVRIGEWGGHMDIGKVKCIDEKVIPSIYSDQEFMPWIVDDPAYGIEIIKPQISYFGPTFTSKVLRFSLPSHFGSIDRNIVLSFGRESTSQTIEHLLDLSLDSKHAAISNEKPYWPTEFGKWTYILRYIANDLNMKKVACPHPNSLVVNKLRESGKWTAADIEMALYTLAVQQKRAVHQRE
jgi:hypothetical protein